MAADTVYPATPALFAKALVDFSRNGLFPDDAELPASHVTNSALQAALTELTKARSELEVLQSSTTFSEQGLTAIERNQSYKSKYCPRC